MLKSEFMCLLTLAGVLALAQVGTAADEPTNKASPEVPPTQDFAKMMKDSQEAMVPYKAKAVEAMLRAQLSVLSDPDSSAAVAKYVHSLYENLLKEGFSKQQALEIVMGMRTRTWTTWR